METTNSVVWGVSSGFRRIRSTGHVIEHQFRWEATRMEEARERYAFEHYMLGVDHPQRVFDPEFEAVRAFSAARMARLLTPTDNFSLEKTAEQMVAPWARCLTEQVVAELVGRKLHANDAVTQHAFLGALMQDLQPGAAAAEIWQVGNPESVALRERVPVSLLRYVLAVLVKNRAQDSGVIRIDRRSSLVTLTS